MSVVTQELVEKARIAQWEALASQSKEESHMQSLLAEAEAQELREEQEEVLQCALTLLLTH